MRYLSVCSGIEAATVAWHPLGWQAAAFSEIEPFPCSVLAHHYPDVPNLGDMTKFKEWPEYDIDVLVGGTPCQSFSVAGLRKGLDDPRGNLMLTYLAIADKYRPRWLVWENVPGVLSSNGGKDFGTFLGGLAELGYGFAYRVLDAQYFGVAQRRRRVFVVGCLGDWRGAAAVLFERDSLCGNPAPSRETGQEIAGTITSSLGRRCGQPDAGDTPGHLQPIAFGGNDTRGPIDVATARNACASASGRMDFESETFLVQSVALRGREGGATAELGDDVANALRCGGGGGDKPHVLAPVPLQEVGKRTGASTNDIRAGIGIGEPGDAMYTLQAGAQHGVHHGMAVRRLMPSECELLQGFPKGYTLVQVRGKPAADGPRYKALGNSMAVPVMRWIGQRIQAVHDITKSLQQAA